MELLRPLEGKANHLVGHHVWSEGKGMGNSWSCVRSTLRWRPPHHLPVSIYVCVAGCGHVCACVLVSVDGY